MNCLEVRRILATDPYNREQSLLDHVAACDECGSAMHSAQRFERLLRESVNVPVPENLASKVLLKQSFVQNERRSRWWKWPLAMAATIVLAVSLHFGVPFVSPTTDETESPKYPVRPSLSRSTPSGEDQSTT